MTRAPADILLVDDSPSDAMLCRAALAECGVACRCHHVENGQDGIAFLRREAGYADAPRPQLILLDLNMPRMGGHAVLETIKSDPGLLQIPVVVLTTSAAESDVQGAYGRHANAYMRKPIEFGEFVDAMKMLVSFWLVATTLPPDPNQDKHA